MSNIGAESSEALLQTAEVLLSSPYVEDKDKEILTRMLHHIDNDDDDHDDGYINFLLYLKRLSVDESNNNKIRPYLDSKCSI